MEWTVFFRIVVCWFSVMIFCSTKAIHQTFNCFRRWIGVYTLHMYGTTFMWNDVMIYCWRSEPIPIGSRMERTCVCVCLCLCVRMSGRETPKAESECMSELEHNKLSLNSSCLRASTWVCQEMAPLWPLPNTDRFFCWSCATIWRVEVTLKPRQ